MQDEILDEVKRGGKLTHGEIAARVRRARKSTAAVSPATSPSAPPGCAEMMAIEAEPQGLVASPSIEMPDLPVFLDRREPALAGVTSPGPSVVEPYPIDATVIDKARELLTLLGDRPVEWKSAVIEAMAELLDQDPPPAPSEPAPVDTADEEEEPAPRRKRAQKLEPRQVTIEDAVEEAFDELQELGSEMRDWADNMPESLQSTEKYERLSVAADTLEQISDSPPQVEDSLKGLDIKITDPPARRRGYSRAARCGQAVYLLEAVIEKLEEVGGDDAAALVEELTTAKDEAEGVEFPGMYD